MIKNSRILPRYQTKKMGIKIVSQKLKESNVLVDNLSLGGIKLFLNEKIDQNLLLSFTLKLGTQDFPLSANVVWQKEGTEEYKYSYGLQLIFSEEKSYQRWLTLMKALHEHNKKK